MYPIPAPAAAILIGSLCFALASPVGAQPPGDGPNAHSRVGTNLGGVSYYSSSWFFTDAMKMAREWVPQLPTGGPWNTQAKLTLDADGWPLLGTTQSAGTLMFVGVDDHYPAGDYLCLYDGKGEIEFGFAAAVKSRQPGRIVVTVKPDSSGIYLKIRTSDPNDHIRNIRLIMPGFENTYQTQVFHPDFLARLRKYRVLRFMDWQRTNNSALQQWGDRTRPQTYSQGLAGGVALEHMIDLCNELQADAWFCIPHLADDDFAKRFAELVALRLDPGLQAYVEYSNEVWNGAFGQSTYAGAEGLRLNLTTNAQLAVPYFYATRSMQLFGIWATAFAKRGGLVKVLSTQFASEWITRKLLDYKSVNKAADVLAVAPYFSASLTTTPTTVAEILTAADQQLDGLVLPMFKSRKALADGYGLPLITYEGGQHLVDSNNAALTSLFIAANRDPGMAALYRKYLRAWFQDVGGLFCHFSHCTGASKYGSWGSFEYENQPLGTAPKFVALQEMIDETAPVVSFGTGCAGLRIGSTGRPALGQRISLLQDGGQNVGQRRFILGMSKRNWGALNLPVELSAAGAPGCWLLVSGALIVAPSRSLPGGGAALDLQIPTDPALFGIEVFAQGYAVTKGGNPAGLAASGGMRLRVVAR